MNARNAATTADMVRTDRLHRRTAAAGIGLLAVAVVGSVVAFATAGAEPARHAVKERLGHVSLLDQDGSRLTMGEALGRGPVLVVNGSLPKGVDMLIDRMGVKSIVVTDAAEAEQDQAVPILQDRLRRLDPVLEVPAGTAVIVTSEGKRSRPMNLDALSELV